jgi:nucleotide-binding universal stress UspA family protein
MVQTIFGRFLLLLLAGVAAACTTQSTARSTIDRVLLAPDLPNAPYSNIVLVGVAPSRELAREFEQGLSDELSERGVQVHSFVKESSAREATAEAVANLVNATGADAILMVTGRLAGAEIDEHEEIVDVEARNIGGNLLNFFRYDYREFTEPTYTDVTVDVKLVSLLFDAASNERVHSVEVSTTDGETEYHVITSQSEAIVDRMKKDELIP